MRPGTVVRTPYVRHYFPPPPKGQPGIVWEDWKARAGHIFALLLLGAEPKDGSAQIDPDEFLKAHGWLPESEVKPLRDALTALWDHHRGIRESVDSAAWDADVERRVVAALGAPVQKMGGE